ncbi:DNA repair ATPase [Thauera phenylacetica B4P]|uniref:DNA repair ATPase n=1 Tax=Thauera phenylacetica B4P TaxID=1234382 RepID=N6Z5G1_9RHOO|nr:hypothetical protein [Thauera phenylacetica]ENO99135.1 DNA repair ATPase [Thauera phenylacetica B4P]
MYPLSLTLKGFRGIRDGLGLDVLTLDLERLAGDAELVALSGANGRGKSTILDNLQPFQTLPSRASLAGPGGFSYYDHVVLPESEKDLVWLHEGRRFRSQIVIRNNGRRATDAFLFEADAEGRWRPVVRNRSLSGVLCPPAPTRNNPSHIHQGGAGSDQGDSDQQQVAAA